VARSLSIGWRAGRAGLPGPARAGRLAVWSDAVQAGGLVALASGLPLVVTTRWYDYYYWPKIVVLYAATALLTLAAVFTDRDRWLRAWGSPVGRALLVWLGAVALATGLSVDRLTSLVGADYRYEGLLTWLAYAGLVALGASTLATAVRVRTFLAFLLLAAAVMAALGLLQRWGWRPVPEDVLRADLVAALPRAWGTTGSPLALGAYLVLLLPISISLCAWEARAGLRCVYGILVLLLYAALVATMARAAWGAFAVGLVAWGAAAGARRLREAAWSLVLLALLCAAVTRAVLSAGPAGTAGSVLAHVPSQGTAIQRLFLWRTVAPLVVRRPLLGWGPETLAEVYPAYGDPRFTQVFPEARMQHLIVDRPHNDLLQQAVSAGLIGLAAYGWLWLAMLWTAWRAARSTARAPGPGPWIPPGSKAGARPIVRTSYVAGPAWAAPGGVRAPGGGGGPAEGRLAAAVASGLFGGLVAYLAQLQFSFSFVSVAPVFWILVGLLLALSRPGGPLLTVHA
jgi:O-antigen ligase